MKTSMATVSISGELIQKLEAIAQAGFHGVEIFENDFLIYNESASDIRRIVRDLGMEISLFQPFRNFEGMPEPQRSRIFDRAERKFDIMHDLGTDLLLVCSNISDIAMGGLDRAADDLRELGERAKKRGMKIGYEALAWGKYIHDHRDAWEIVRRADHSHVGLILDSFHTLARGIDVNSIRSIPREKLFLVQLADAPAHDMDLLQWSRHYRNMPGEGDLPVLEFMQAVAETGYDGYLSLEIFNDQFRGALARRLASDGHRSLIYLCDEVKRSLPQAKLQLPDMPAPINVQKIAFIEFTASPEDAEMLQHFFRKLGFRLTGQHKTKQVIRMQQGDINLIINTEKQGFANSSYLVHGTSVYAFGLEVDNVKQALSRALMLENTCLHAEDEKMAGPMSAVRCNDGSLIYLVDRSPAFVNLWEDEFNPVTDHHPVQDAGLVAIDHLAQTMDVHEMPSALLFYRSLFNVCKTPPVDILDPAGITSSQVIENGDGSLRITLNGADNRRTLAGHFLAEKFGTSIQHIAFSTENIFATAQHLHKNGFVPLAISPNYYDDIEARYGLEPDFTERLRSANILYDRDDKGEYFQIYSSVIGEGFFLEIVERKAYKGYGAANAIFRIAAQKRYLRLDGIPHLQQSRLQAQL